MQIRKRNATAFDERRRSACRFLLACIAILVPYQTATAAEEEEAVHLYKQLKPSIVSFQNIEGSGTGIILDPDGLILTNAHVVTSPAPFDVQVDSEVAPGKPSVSLTFKKVKVVGYDQRQDLALVRIDVKEHPAVVLKPVTRSKTKGEPGQRVYVIGNPGAGGKILIKSISSGMLSAVDRVVDGKTFYQTDAAINPGNSGGPMCDRNGNVLGLVTLKMSDVESIGFAIPLQDLDVKSFVPLTQRKGDSKRARRLVELGSKLLNMAADAIKKNKDKVNEQAEAYLANATECFHDALFDDPANASIFFDIGVMRQLADWPEAAAAYFARAIQLDPWNEMAGAFYVRLGMVLTTQKQDDRALTVWSEGVAKYPYSAMGWAYLAIYYDKHRRPTDAARCAATAMLIGSKDLPADTLAKILTSSRNKVTGAAATALERETSRSGLIAILDGMVTVSNVARKARTIFINKPCSDLIATFGGVPITDLEKNIPQTEIPPASQWAMADSATPGPGAAPKGKAGHKGAAAGPGDPPQPAAAGERTEVSVSAKSGENTPVNTGIRLARGQYFVLEPNATDTWRVGKKGFPQIDYHGDPNGRGVLMWKVGGTSGVVVSGKSVAAPEAGTLELFCSDLKPKDNSGAIRVAVTFK